jgi:hypothetical protein
MHYDAECGASAQWGNGKKSCSLYDESIFLTISDEPDFEQYTAFKLKLQNTGNDTIQALPANM